MTRCLLLACIATSLAAAVAEPAPMPDDKAFAVVVVPDLLGTLGHCERIAELFAPGAVKAGSLAQLAGRRLGDPGLTKLGHGPVVLAIAPNGMAPAMAALIPSAEPEVHIAALQQAGVQAEAAGTLVVTGNQAADLSLGRRLVTAYPALAAMPINGDLRLLIAPNRISNAYRPMFPGMIQMMTAQLAKQPDGATVAAVLALEIYGFVALADQTATVQVDVALADQVVTIHSLVAAVPGAALAKALVAPPPATGPAPALRMGTEQGYMACTMRWNGPALCGWLADLLAEMQAKPEIKDLITDATIAEVRDAGTVWTGGFAMRIRATETNFMTMDGAFDCPDLKTFDDGYRRMIDLLFGDTAFGRMYAQMGMSASVDKDVRHVGGLPVQRIHYTLDAEKLPAAQREQMQAMLHDVEYTAMPGTAMMASRPEDLDRLVAGGAGELVTTAALTMAQGHDGYADLDYLAMFKAMIASQAMPQMQGVPFAAALNATQTGDPLGFAWTMADGRAAIDVRVPLRAFAEFANALRQGGGPAEPVEQPTF